ncbi:EARLY NODULIN-LIKE PROTEIN 2 [Salix koriyanagi]|uniref:EARLY NODULIN-LIKE PROTEIN 2 n=1 Tax=Salix koriyanagi TaxID=2511006 RepID=A0A9Q1AMA0_9ROSI|nr:EARLY NODULIN-LIKE PROTEIN 2 [Salix koriyanagi]
MAGSQPPRRVTVTGLREIGSRSMTLSYNNGSDSVLLVTKDDYNSCNTTNPIKTMNSGSDVFQFDKSGPYFFISGNEDNCEKGQKLIVTVLSAGTRRATAPVSLPPALSPETPSPNLQPTLKVHRQCPVESLPPSAVTPTLAPYPASMAPTGAPGPSPAAMTPHISLVPSGPPASAPGSDSSPSPSIMLPPAPSQSPESPSPLAGGPPAPAPGSSIASTPSPNPKAPALAPAPPPAASWVATPSTVMVIVASFLVSSVIGAWP